MTGSVALDVVIGLVFVYLLYSLLATVISEIIATNLGLRARNLREAVNRMLSDEDKKNLLDQLGDSMNLLKRLKNPKKYPVINNFYNEPEIKYLGSSGLFQNPSAFKSGSFSRALLTMLFGGKLSKEEITNKIDQIIQDSNSSTTKLNPNLKLDKDTAAYIKTLWEESYGDLVKFKLHLENWFDRTMEQASEWYKRKIQFVLLVIGFMMAWVFNADTFEIIQKLSTDTDAREKLVSMANAYVQNNKSIVDETKITDTVEIKEFKQKLDSLLKVKKVLEADVQSVNTVLGLGGWLPDTVHVYIDKRTKEKTYNPPIDAASLSERQHKFLDGKLCLNGNKCNKPNCTIKFCTADKWGYFFRLLYHHFFGFLLTAIAISLGAPFWFDLLSKLMKLKASVKQEPSAQGPSTAENSVSPLNREA